MMVATDRKRSRKPGMYAYKIIDDLDSAKDDWDTFDWDSIDCPGMY
jgi:hypothetical protein